MRILILLACCLLLSTQCASKKSARIEALANDTIEFVYKKHTRGFYREYHVRKNNIITYLDYNKTTSESKKTIPLDWVTCLNLLTPLDLEGISTLQPPSDLRATDRVLHAEVIITINDNTFRSSNFDHGNPPEIIKPLVDHLIYMVSNH